MTQLSAFVGQVDVARWEQLEKKIQEKRNTDVNAMDAMDVKEDKGNGFAGSRYSIIP